MNQFEYPFGFHQHSRSTERRDEDGRETRLVGQDVSTWASAVNNLAIPEEDRGHPLVARRYFYTLPLDVLDAVVTELGEERSSGNESTIRV